VVPVPRVKEACLSTCPAGHTEQNEIRKYDIEAKHHPKAIRWFLHDLCMVRDQLSVTFRVVLLFAKFVSCVPSRSQRSLPRPASGRDGPQALTSHMKYVYIYFSVTPILRMKYHMGKKLLRDCERSFKDSQALSHPSR